MDIIKKCVAHINYTTNIKSFHAFYIPDRFSIFSTLFKAKLRYSNFFNLPTFSEINHSIKIKSHMNQLTVFINFKW